MPHGGFSHDAGRRYIAVGIADHVVAFWRISRPWEPSRRRP
jgi:hypothetical protein